MTREAAREAGLKRYQPRKPCRHGHNSERLVSDGKCLACKRIKERRQYVLNAAKKCAATNAYRARNPEQARARVRAWTQRNRERVRINGRVWQRKYQAAKAKRMPTWADSDAIAVIYRAAEIARTTFGRDVHVDHKVPLNGRLVSGLHVHTNLQIITAQHNQAKSNRF